MGADAAHRLPGGTTSADACSSALSDRKTITWTVLTPGVVLLIVGGVGALIPVQAKRE